MKTIYCTNNNCISSFTRFTCCSVYNPTLHTFTNYRYVGWGFILNSLMLAVGGHHRDEVKCIVSRAWGLIRRMERNCSLKHRTMKVAQDGQRLTTKVLRLHLLLRHNQVSCSMCILFVESRNSGKTFNRMYRLYIVEGLRGGAA